MLRLVGVMVVLTAVVTMSRLGGRLEAAEPVNVLTMAFGSMDDCVDCFECGGNGHKAFQLLNGYHELGAGVHSTCFETGSCALQHPMTCNIGSTELKETLERVRLAVLAADEVQLIRIVGDDDRVQFVQTRSAVQVVGCGGQVVAHFPVGAEVVESLLGSLSTTR